jgi:hypothetical protein
MIIIIIIIKIIIIIIQRGVAAGAGGGALPANALLWPTAANRIRVNREQLGGNTTWWHGGRCNLNGGCGRAPASNI